MAGAAETKGIAGSIGDAIRSALATPSGHPRRCARGYTHGPPIPYTHDSRSVLALSRR